MCYSAKCIILQSDLQYYVHMGEGAHTSSLNEWAQEEEHQTH